MSHDCTAIGTEGRGLPWVLCTYAALLGLAPVYDPHRRSASSRACGAGGGRRLRLRRRSAFREEGHGKGEGWGGQKTHDGGLCFGVAWASRALAEALLAVLSASQGIHQRVQALLD